MNEEKRLRTLPKAMKRFVFRICFINSLLFVFLFNIGFSHASHLSTTYPKSRFFVRDRDGLFYVRIKDVPLVAVLKEISAQTKVKMHIVGNLDRQITLKSYKTPLDQLIIKLIEGTANYAFIYSQPSVLKEIWIFSKRKETRPEVAPFGYKLRDLVARQREIEAMEDIHNAEVKLSMSPEDFAAITDAEKRLEVTEMLGQARSEQALELLIYALGDRDGDVRETAAYGLGKMGDMRAVEPLVKCLQDEEPWVRSSAADALAVIGDQSALHPLLDALDVEKDQDARESMQEAVNALSR